jgi:cyclopropane fatty-acyl-phospholipid synthase-like methyltransferase
MPTYIHGYSREEQERLTLMQQLVNEAELQVLDLAGAERILDVGAGLGQMVRALARAAGPSAHVMTPA